MYHSQTTNFIHILYYTEEFDNLPYRPDYLKSNGLILHLINCEPGIVTNVNHEDEILSLPSVVHLYLECGVGDYIEKTVNIRTDSGYVLLQHDDPNVIAADFHRILELRQ